MYILFTLLFFSVTMDGQLSELVAKPSGEFQKFTRMSQSDFDDLLNKVLPAIAKQDTQLRNAIPARIRLAITLRYLATGDSFESLHFLFKISPQLISKIIPEVCQALIEALKEEIKVSNKTIYYKKCLLIKRFIFNEKYLFINRIIY